MNSKTVLLYFNFVLLISFSSVIVHAQQEDNGISDVFNKPEIGITLGANNFLGDLGGNVGKGEPFLKDYTWQTLRPLVGASIAFYPQNWYQLKVGFNYTSVDGADSLIPPTTDLARWRIYRNLSFNSHIWEAYFTGQVYPITFFDPAYTVHRLSPFLEFGIGIFHFNPTTQLDGQTVYLQPLDLEGQTFAEYPDRKQFKLLQVYLPVSIGIKYYLSDKLSISGGIEFRKTFTDYIDDVSTSYIDPSLFAKYLSPSQAILAEQLYSRSLRPEKVKPGVLRAFSTADDTYTTVFITLNLVVGGFRNFYYGGHDRSRDGQLYR